MTTMQAELYDALVSAGADEAKARRAAEEAAGHHNRFDSLGHRFDDVKSSLEHRIDEVRFSLERRIDEVRFSLERRIDGVNADLSSKIDGVNADLSNKIVELAGRVNPMQWMLGLLVGGVTAIIFKLFG